MLPEPETTGVIWVFISLIYITLKPKQHFDGECFPPPAIAALVQLPNQLVGCFFAGSYAIAVFENAKQFPENMILLSLLSG